MKIILLILSLFLLSGCSFIGKVGYLTSADSTSAWTMTLYPDIYNWDYGKNATFYYRTDGLSLKVHTNQLGNRGLRQPWDLGIKTILFGPPFLAVVPNIIFLQNEYGRKYKEPFVVWIVFESSSSSIVLDSAQIKLTRLDSMRIYPKNVLVWKKDPICNGCKWTNDSTNFPLRIERDTLALSLEYEFSSTECEGFTLSFANEPNQIPRLSVKRQSEWFYDYFHFHGH